MSDTPKNQPKSSAKSPHPFVSDEKIKAHYYTDCRACKNETKWRADVTGALCTVCYTFVPRDSIGGAPPEELDDKLSAELLIYRGVSEDHPGRDQGPAAQRGGDHRTASLGHHGPSERQHAR